MTVGNLIRYMRTAIAHTSIASLEESGCPAGVTDVIKDLQCTAKVPLEMLRAARVEASLAATAKMMSFSPTDRQQVIQQAVADFRASMTVSRTMPLSCQSLRSASKALEYSVQQEAAQLEVDLQNLAKPMDKQWRELDDLMTLTRSTIAHLAEVRDHIII
jgi:hypothetical protein